MKRVSSVKNVLFCFLILACLLALPAASLAQQPTQTPSEPTALPATKTAVAATRSVVEARGTAQARRTAEAAQATATPTAVHEFPLSFPTQREISSCGLPPRSAIFTSAVTLNMTADCYYSFSDVHENGTSLLNFSFAGVFTINGNGYSIVGPTGVSAINVANGATLNLNNVGIRSAGGASRPVIHVSTVGRLNATNVGFYSNRGPAVIVADGNAQISLTNARFRGNRVWDAVIRSTSGFNNAVTINQAEFQDNRIDGGDSVIDIQSGSLTLEGRIGFRSNPTYLGREANRYYFDNVGSFGTLTDTDAVFYIIPPPKKKKEEEVRPTLTPTARPRYAASYTALQTATGMTFEATYGLDSGVHFRQLDGAGIGIQSIIDAGYLAALDVYGYVEQGVEVCFPQIGRVVFLDARTMPRAIVPLNATVRDGMTCVFLDSPGSLVLLPQ